jgi:hypothetical protein
MLTNGEKPAASTNAPKAALGWTGQNRVLMFIPDDSQMCYMQVLVVYQGIVERIRGVVALSRRHVFSSD